MIRDIRKRRSAKIVPIRLRLGAACLLRNRKGLKQKAIVHIAFVQPQQSHNRHKFLRSFPRFMAHAKLRGAFAFVSALLAAVPIEESLRLPIVLMDYRERFETASITKLTDTDVTSENNFAGGTFHKKS